MQENSINNSKHEKNNFVYKEDVENKCTDLCKRQRRIGIHIIHHTKRIQRWMNISRDISFLSEIKKVSMKKVFEKIKFLDIK